jgi:hypothetical protein
MTNKQIITILAVSILISMFIPVVSAADPCSFCEFINISNITRGVTDHSLLTNLSADDHHQYILTDGSRAFTGKQSLGGFNLTNLLDPVAAQDAATKNYVDAVNTSMQAYVDQNHPITDHGLLSNLSGDGHPQYLLVDGTRAMGGNLNMGSNQIFSLITGTTGDTATNKTYVDTINSSMKSYVDSVVSDTAPGSNGQVLYNQGGAEGANASFTFNNSTGTVTATFFVGDGSGLTGIGETSATALTFDVKAGEILTKGQPVYLSGASGANPIVMKADNTITSKTRVVGLITSNLATNGQGHVRRAGTLTAVDTSGVSEINPNGESWAAGDLLFLTSTGGMTNVRPTSGRSVKCAYTLKGSNTQDTLLVYPFENPVWITAASGENVVLRLGDSSGVNKTSFSNYVNTEVAYVNSQGYASFNGTTMQSKNISAVLDPVAAQDAATKNYVDTTNTTMKTYVDTVNSSMKSYVDAYAATAGTTKLSSDFYDGTTNAIPGLLGAAISAGTVGSVATTANHPGVIYMRDSTTIAGGYRYGCTGTQLIGGGETFDVVFQPVGVRSTQGAQLGWSDSTAANTLPGDGIWFNISGTGAAIVLKGATSSNSIRSYTGSTYAPTTATWYRGTIRVNTAGTLVTYTIYNEAGASQWTDTVATNIPTGAGRDTSPCIIVAESTIDAPANILVMDYVNWGSTRTLVR